MSMKVILKKTIDLSFVQINIKDWVVIKPNLVKESKETDPDEWESVITSPELIKVVTEYVCRQLKGTGKITICDAPQTDSGFEKIVKRLDLLTMATELTKKFGTPIEVIDLRNEEWINEGGVITKRNKLPGDPNGAITFNMARKSLFYNHSGEGKYYGADYDYKTLNNHHKGETHEYLICATPVMADVFINLPKMKTHKKTGVTLSLKNLVGINADKNWLPHHTFGFPGNGGDEYPDISIKRRLEMTGSRTVKRIAFKIPVLGPRLARFFRNRGAEVFGEGSRTIRSGNWYGNDTTWRMALDLNRCLLYGNTDGTLRNNNPKKYYTIVDGEICMEGNGPMQGTPKKCGIFIGGSDPVAVDSVAATMMGFDWGRIPLIREAFYLTDLPITNCKPEEIIIESDVPEWDGTLENLRKQKHFDFEPHFGWKNYIELPDYEHRK
jgi:uncharacterized protein (DUF362 family)